MVTRGEYEKAVKVITEYNLQIIRTESERRFKEYDSLGLNRKLNSLELALSIRTLNCLMVADICTLGELVDFNKYDLLKIRGFGANSLRELDNLLEKEGLCFGMKV